MCVASSASYFLWPILSMFFRSFLSEYIRLATGKEYNFQSRTESNALQRGGSLQVANEPSRRQCPFILVNSNAPPNSHDPTAVRLTRRPGVHRTASLPISDADKYWCLFLTISPFIFRQGFIAFIFIYFLSLFLFREQRKTNKITTFKSNFSQRSYKSRFFYVRRP